MPLDEKLVEDPELESSAEDGAEGEGEGDAEGKGVKGNVYARLRIAERDKRKIEERFNSLVTALQTPEEEADQDFELPEYDEDDPLKSLHKGQEVLAKRQDALARTQKQKEERERLEAARSAANDAIIEFSEDTPDYKNAIKHLIDSEIQDILEEDDSLTSEEADQALTNKLESLKVRWIKAGKNPGEEFYKRAKRRGYRESSKVVKSDEDPKEEVRKGKEKEKKATTISSVPGRNASPEMTATMALKLGRKEYDAWRDEIAREKGGIMKPLKFRDLMPNKIQKGAKDLLKEAGRRR